MEAKLKTKHIIMLSKLVSKMGIAIDFKKSDEEKLGGEIVMDLISNIHLAESEFYELIGSISHLSPAEAAEAEIEDLIDVLTEVVNKIKLFIKSKAA